MATSDGNVSHDIQMDNQNSNFNLNNNKRTNHKARNNKTRSKSKARTNRKTKHKNQNMQSSTVSNTTHSQPANAISMLQSSNKHNSSMQRSNPSNNNHTKSKQEDIHEFLQDSNENVNTTESEDLDIAGDQQGDDNELDDQNYRNNNYDNNTPPIDERQLSPTSILMPLKNEDTSNNEDILIDDNNEDANVIDKNINDLSTHPSEVMVNKFMPHIPILDALTQKVDKPDMQTMYQNYDQNNTQHKEIFKQLPYFDKATVLGNEAPLLMPPFVIPFTKEDLDETLMAILINAYKLNHISYVYTLYWFIFTLKFADNQHFKS